MSKQKTKSTIKNHWVLMTLMSCAIVCLCSFAVLEADNDELTEEEQAEIEEEAEEKEDKVDDLEDELEDIQKDKEKYVQKKLIISNEISQLDSNIAVIEDEITRTENELDLIKQEIEKKEEKISKKKQILSDILWRINQTDLEVQLILLGNSNDFGDYFKTIDTLEQYEKRLFDAVMELKREKEEFETKKQEQQNVFEVHSDQKNTLQSEKTKKAVVLNQTQSEINQKDASISEIQSKINRLKLDISMLLGKGYDAEDIKDAVKYASKKTGVRKDFLMGMLVVESDLGRFTGGCDYKESRMNDHRKKLFKEICKDLDYNYKKMKVSCPPAGYVGTGGAMGVAQFMSDTWMGYQDAIAANTGHDPPDPWDLTDGVMAMALKLANDGATKKSGECKAAKRYLGGSHQWYCDKVQYWADHYKKLID
jgi:membrane-bound lytic murein transglycosylase B